MWKKFAVVQKNLRPTASTECQWVERLKFSMSSSTNGQTLTVVESCDGELIRESGGHVDACGLDLKFAASLEQSRTQRVDEPRYAVRSGMNFCDHVPWKNGLAHQSGLLHPML